MACGASQLCAVASASGRCGLDCVCVRVSITYLLTYLFIYLFILSTCHQLQQSEVIYKEDFCEQVSFFYK